MAIHCDERTGPVSIHMVENRSGIHPGLRWATMAWMGVAIAIAGLALFRSLWLVSLFELAMLTALIRAFEVHRRRQPVRERLTLERGEMHHDIVSAGRIDRCSIARPFCRAEVRPGGKGLVLVDHSLRRTVGDCLCEREREQLADLLARHGVRCRTVAR
jgi:uncharacterized membrane protein